MSRNGRKPVAANRPTQPDDGRAEREKMSELKRYGLVRCSKKTGKIDTAMTGLGKGLLQLWGLQNTTKSKRTVIFELDTGIIETMYTGTADGFPEVEKGISSKGLMVNEDLRAEMAGEAEA